MIGPPLPPGMTEKSEGSNEDSDSDDDDDSHKFPITSELDLLHGTKAISALSVDPAGSRLVSGSIDYDVKYWDFQGMGFSRESFRSFRPADGYPVQSIDYSCSGDKVLVVSGSPQGKVYDRDGVEVYECTKGDMYLQDMAKTKGHIASLTGGKWHPKNKEEFLTSARDGTCRIWDVSRPLQQTYVLKTKASNGLKTHPNACNYSRDGLLVACACEDGSFLMWDHRKSFVNTCMNFRNAHQKGESVSSFSFSYDSKSFVTRGEDSLKLWDVRNNKKCIFEQNNLFSRFSTTDCLFSPNDKLVVTGTSKEKDEKAGKLKFFERDTFNLVKELEIGLSHVVRVVWHPRLNQIMLGCGDGKIRILYDEKESRNGAIYISAKKKKQPKKFQGEVSLSRPIITPHALPLFRDDRHKGPKKREVKDRQDPVRSHQPERPLGKLGSGGRVAAGGSTLSSYIIRNMGIRNKLREEEDPREALLKYAKDASESPFWVSPAYAKTQPKPIFQQPDLDDNDKEENQPSKKLKKD